MHFTAAEITGWLGSFLWPFFRIGALMMSAPITSGNLVPTRVRLVLAVAISIVVAPLIDEVPTVDPFSLSALLIVVQQILIGVAIGFALQLVFQAVITGGQVIAMQVGLGFASMLDPQNGMNVPVISQLLLMMTTLLFLAMDAHLMMIKVLVDSFTVMPIAPDGLSRAGFWELANWGRDLFAGALWMALPVVASLLVIKIAFGVMARAAPQMNIFSIGFPVFIIGGVLLVEMLMPGMVPQFSSMVEGGFSLVDRLFSGGVR